MSDPDEAQPPETAASADVITRVSRRTPLDLEILQRTNEARARQQLPPLKWSRILAASARRHATAVAEGREPFSHSGAHERFAACSCKCINVAENLARSEGYCRDDLPQVAVSSWCQSEGHRRNLLGPFDSCGIGWAASDSGVIFVTQLLALIDESSAWRGQLKETAVDVVTSTPAVCSAFGLVLGGSVLAVGGGILGGLLDNRLGVKASSLPKVIYAKGRGMWRRHACSSCGFVPEDAGGLWANSSGDQALLCARCRPSATADGSDWCFLD